MISVFYIKFSGTPAMDYTIPIVQSCLNSRYCLKHQ